MKIIFQRQLFRWAFSLLGFALVETLIALLILAMAFVPIMSTKLSLQTVK